MNRCCLREQQLENLAGKVLGGSEEGTRRAERGCGWESQTGEESKQIRVGEVGESPVAASSG